MTDKTVRRALDRLVKLVNDNESLAQSADRIIQSLIAELQERDEKITNLERQLEYYRDAERSEEDKRRFELK